MGALVGRGVVGAVEMIRLDTIQPNSWNPNHIAPDIMASLVHGLQHDGWLASQALLVWGTDEKGVQKNLIIDGEHRYRGALQLGFEFGPAVVLLGLPEYEAKALTIKMNQKRGAFDPVELGAVLRSIKDSFDGEEFGMNLGIVDNAELDRLIATMPTIGDTSTPPIDTESGMPPIVEPDTPDAPVVPITKLGDVWKLGVHLLICGDSRDPKVWEKLLQGQKAKAMWTDPPYGVGYVGKTSDKMTIENDEIDDKKLDGLLGAVFDLAVEHCVKGAPWYVSAPAGPLHWVFAKQLITRGIYRQTLVWAKDQFVLGRSDYHYRHEPIFYGWVPGTAHFFIDDRTLDSIFEIPRPRANREHPTMKPIELVARCLKNSTKRAWLVVDPFGGSGTTLLAGEQLGRRTRIMELDPGFCDVIVRRWEALTGKKAELVMSEVV